jgi:PEP-CTERM motif
LADVADLGSVRLPNGARLAASLPLQRKGRKMIKRTFLLAMTATVTATTVAPANAAVLLFQLTGSRNATFAFDPTTTTPDFRSSSFIGDQLTFNAVRGTFGGVDGTARVGFGNFLVADLNIQSPNLGFTQFTATPDFFRFVNTKPDFTLGTFQLNSIVSGRSELTISQFAAGGVPEPTTWAMLILGFGMVGGAIRYRRRTAGFCFAPAAR